MRRIITDSTVSCSPSMLLFLHLVNTTTPELVLHVFDVAKLLAAGRVQYNKEPATTKLYRNLVRLSPTEDAVEGFLTVLQNLQLAAHLSLPPHFTPHRRASLIEEVLDLLGLAPMRHCLVGTPATPGIAHATAGPVWVTILSGQKMWSARCRVPPIGCCSTCAQTRRRLTAVT